jgi:DNA-binding IclR family transcriptional regulator
MSEPVRAAERALDILACFKQGQLALSLTQVADIVGMPKSTVFRLLATLEGKRFISRDAASGVYHLGFRFIEMGSLVLQDLDIQQWALPYLQRLAAECGETVDLAALDGKDVVYLQVIESQLRVRLAAATGQRLPAYCTASGKAFLAYLPQDQKQKILANRLEKYTSNTKILLSELENDLMETYERGFAISEQEYEKDINAVAAPILNVDEYPILVIAVAGPSFRLPFERMLALGKSMRTLADTIAREMGSSTLSAILAMTSYTGKTGTIKERYL